MESNIYQQQNNYLAPNVATQDVESILKLQEMIFIYNAIKDGWTVRMLEDGRFEFQKERKKITSDVCMDSYLQNFIKYYMRIDKLL